MPDPCFRIYASLKTAASACETSWASGHLSEQGLLRKSANSSAILAAVVMKDPQLEVW